MSCESTSQLTRRVAAMTRLHLHGGSMAPPLLLLKLALALAGD